MASFAEVQYCIYADKTLADKVGGWSIKRPKMCWRIIGMVTYLPFSRVSLRFEFQSFDNLSKMKLNFFQIYLLDKTINRATKNFKSLFSPLKINKILKFSLVYLGAELLFLSFLIATIFKVFYF